MNRERYADSEEAEEAYLSFLCGRMAVTRRGESGTLFGL
jgi:hypothetical protein